MIDGIIEKHKTVLMEEWHQIKIAFITNRNGQGL